MSALILYIHAARAMLDERDKKAPIFDRTNALFSEIEEATGNLVDILTALLIAKTSNDVSCAKRLTFNLVTVTQQIAQLSIWARQHFDREK